MYGTLASDVMEVAEGVDISSIEMDIILVAGQDLA